MLAEVAPAGFSKLGAALGQGQQPKRCAGKRASVAGRRKQARAGAQQVARAKHVGGDDRHALRHGFQRGKRQG